MADPLSIAASIIAVLQATAIAAQGIEKIYAARNAAREVSATQEEGRQLLNVVSMIKNKLEMRPRLTIDTQQHLLDQLRRAEAVALELDVFVKNVQKKGSTRVKKMSYLWADVKGEAKILRRELSSAADRLAAAATLALL